MIYKKLGFFVIVCSSLGVWLWARSTPWNKAQRALDRGEPGEAVEVLVQALESKSWSPAREEAMRDLLAQGYLNKGSMDLADQTFRQLREKFPNNFEAALGLGVLSLARERGSFGIEYLEDAKRINPRDIRPYLILAQYFSDIRDYSKAESNLASGFVRFPNDDRLTMLEGDLLFNQGRYQEALAKFKPLMDSVPIDKDLRVKIARTFLYSGDLEKALEIFTVLRPRLGTDEVIESAISRILFFQGRRQESSAISERLYREDNRRYFSGLDWALSLASQGRTEEADHLLTLIGQSILPLGGGILTPVEGVSFNDLERIHAVRILAKSQNILYLRSKSEFAIINGRYSEAGDYLERAFNIDNGDFYTLSQMAELARIKNEPEQRLKWAELAVGKYKEHPAALLLRASIYLDLRRTPDAIIDAKIVSDSYPRLAYAQALLSKAWMIQKKPHSALSAAKRAVELNPGEPAAQLAFAISNASIGNDLEAEAAFRHALEINPRFAEARYEWGRWLKSKGRQKESVFQIQEARRLEPLVYK